MRKKFFPITIFVPTQHRGNEKAAPVDYWWGVLVSGRLFFGFVEGRPLLARRRSQPDDPAADWYLGNARTGDFSTSLYRLPQLLHLFDGGLPTMIGHGLGDWTSRTPFGLSFVSPRLSRPVFGCFALKRRKLGALVAALVRCPLPLGVHSGEETIGNDRLVHAQR